jgi:hypothetical protein
LTRLTGIIILSDRWSDTSCCVPEPRNRHGKS